MSAAYFDCFCTFSSVFCFILQINLHMFMFSSPALPQPALTVNPHVITDTDSVTLSCQTPPSVTESQCDFYIEAEIMSSVSCVQTLTGTDLIKMARRRSPAEVKVRCFYTVMLDALKSASPESDHTTVTINSE